MIHFDPKDTDEPSPHGSHIRYLEDAKITWQQGKSLKEKRKARLIGLGLSITQKYCLVNNDLLGGGNLKILNNSYVLCVIHAWSYYLVTSSFYLLSIYAYNRLTLSQLQTLNR